MALTKANINVLSISASDISLGNVTNESKSTMFSSPAFTGTVDCTGATLKSTTLTSGAAGTGATMTGQWALASSSQFDCSSGTLKTTTLSTGAAATAGTITGTWSLSASSILNATYADVAEHYSSDDYYEPGTVVVFGGSAEVTKSTRFGDTRVAGIVTTNPAFKLNAELEGTHVCIALVGRVPCKVVGVIRKGDFITTSEIAGRGVVPLRPEMGTIIGKALADKLDPGEGVIEVAVGRF